MTKGKPFVKWVGGKRQLMPEIKNLIPKNFNTYYEPFVGGGAVLYDLSHNNVVINDYNSELINVYNCIKNIKKFDKLIKILNTHEVNHSKEYYMEVRSQDRDKDKFKKMLDYKRAARTIYLNKSCFNGLYRVNSKNEFNVPFNKKEKVNTYEKDNLNLIHNYFNKINITILNGDFEVAVKNAKKGDFVYFDPPYDSDSTTFTSYTDAGFGKDEQIRLSKVFKELDKRGVYCMLSNHNTILINELYKDFDIRVVEAKRNINSNGEKRGKVEEVIVINYQIETISKE